MCNKNCPPPNDVQQQQRKQKSGRTRRSNRTITSSITNINKREKQLQPHKSRLPSSSSSSSSPLKQQQQQPSRKTRTKTRRPKYLSLNLVQLSPTHRHHIKMTTHQQQQQQQQQLNLFPLHPENLVEDNNDDNRYIVMHDDVQVASFLFETTTDSSTTLHSLLSPSTTATTTTTESEVDPLSPSLSTYGDHHHHHHHHHHRDHDDDHVGSLVRTAMKKGRERDVSEERWVCYSEVVEKKESEEVASCGFSVGEEDDGSWYGGSGAINNTSKGKFKLLCLKLDYQEILNAWSDKGPLFVEGENPQIVPDLQDPANVLIMDGWGNVGNLWRVPELGGNDDVSGIKVKEEGMETKENWKMDQRQASVLRYKEKRNSRLFSKRIRYEVRKLNAEKRPRLKGRFVKRN